MSARAARHCRKAVKARRASDPLEALPAFMARVKARLEAGRQTYADRSFDRPLPELVQEIREELLDVCGWAFVMWSRLETLDRASRTVEAESRAKVLKATAADRAWMELLLAFAEQTERT